MFFVKLQEKNKDYIRCLNLFLGYRGAADDSERIESIFSWIDTSLSSLEGESKKEFEQHLKKNMGGLVYLSSELTVALVKT